MFKPCGDTVIIEKYVKPKSDIILPDTRPTDQDIYVVKEVGKGYVTEQGQVVPPEVKEGDRVIIIGKIIEIDAEGKTFLLARAQDVVAYERGKK